MKIYGRDLPDVLTEMPWQLKIVVLAGVVWIPFALIHAIFVFTYVSKDQMKPGLVKFSNSQPTAGRFDPSMAPAGRGNELAMTFVEMLPLTDIDTAQQRLAANVQLVTAPAPCKIWGSRGSVFEASQDEILAPDGISSFGRGTWWYETPSIVYDPDDPDPSRKLKVYAYKHLWMGKDKIGIVQHYSTIVYKHMGSTDPGENWSLEKPLFAAGHADPPVPYNDPQLTHLNDLDPSLTNVAFYARPSVIIAGGVYYMTLSAFLADQIDVDRVILISSKDHGITWSYVGTLLHRDDVKKMGPFTKLGGGSLIRKGDKIWFAAVFGDDKSAGLGTFLLRFADLAKGELEADGKTGLPAIVDKIPNNSAKPSEYGGGYAAYNELCKQGIYVSEHSGIKSSSQLFWTMKNPE